MWAELCAECSFIIDAWWIAGSPVRHIEFQSLSPVFKYSSRLRASKLTSITGVIRSTQASISGYLSFRPRKPSTQTGSNTRICHIDLLTTTAFWAFFFFVYSRFILSGFPFVRNVNWLLVFWLFEIFDCERFLRMYLLVRGAISHCPTKSRCHNDQMCWCHDALYWCHDFIQFIMIFWW